MRTLVQLLLILVICLAACWGLSFYTGSLPATISGVVIDWNTGRPAPFTDVRVDRLNFSVTVARTDARGRFVFRPPARPDICFLFAGPPRYGTLLQTTFGETVVMYRKAERVSDVVIPAIPATELSGHVYGSDGRPISGCHVSALTRDTRLDPRANLHNQGWYGTLASDLAAADDPQKFLDIDWVNTDAQGLFTFDRLGADRYFILARCETPAARVTAGHLGWVPMLYPDAAAVASAREILLLPGDRKGGIDFHLQRRPTYNLRGKIIFSDHSAPKPWPQAIYSQDLRVVRSDRSLTSSSWLAWEPCTIEANEGRFRCDGLLPGEYSLYFYVEPGLGASRNIRPQAAKADYRVPNAARQPLVVQLRNLPDGGVRIQRAYTGPGGVLDFGRVCAGSPDGRPAVRVLASGHGYAEAACYYMTFANRTDMHLPEDRYRVEAFEAAFLPKDRGYLGHSSIFEAILMQHGTLLDVQVGRTLRPSLPILTTRQLIGIALTSLRNEH
ncbi:MAG: hypothetical protein JO340_12160 [Acidobacteriaceae bacterium]|nr:hypothetical protein [Acidobacteriaceae bacterium]